MDYISLSYVIALVYFITLTTMIVVWRSNRNTEGVLMWLISAILAFLAFLSIFLLPFIGSLTHFINNSLAATSILFVIRGILKYRKINETKMMKIFYLLIFVIILTISFINRANSTNRFLASDPLMAFLFLVITFSILFRQRKDKHIYILIGMFAFIQSVVFLIRFSYALSGDIEASVGAHPSVSYVFFSIIAWSIAWVIGILLMIQSKHIEKILNFASFDDMTEIMNRRSFERDLTDFFEKSKKDDAFNFVLTIIDVDRFKHINDTYGHQFGDEVLKFFARTLLEAFPKYNVYRIGGDEFAIISYDDYVITDIYTTLQKLQRVSMQSKDDVAVEIGFSYGSCEYSDNYNNTSILYKNADEKMYQLKKERDIKQKSIQ